MEFIAVFSLYAFDGKMQVTINYHIIGPATYGTGSSSARLLISDVPVIIAIKQAPITEGGSSTLPRKKLSSDAITNS